MSKMDGLRAMREARYAAAQAGAPTKKAARPPVAPEASAAPAKARAKAKRAPAKAAAAAEPAGSEELCGHRNMGGKTCTREQGHAAKSHRYS